jgi:hypothetical protein
MVPSLKPLWGSAIGPALNAGLVWSYRPNVCRPNVPPGPRARAGTVGISNRGVTTVARTDIATFGRRFDPRLEQPKLAVTIASVYWQNADCVGSSDGILVKRHMYGEPTYGILGQSWNTNRDTKFIIQVGATAYISGNGGLPRSATNTPYLIVGRWESGTAPVLWIVNLISGAVSTQTGSTSATGPLDYTRYYSGTATSAEGFLAAGREDESPAVETSKGRTEAAFVWSRRLTDGEVNSLARLARSVR